MKWFRFLKFERKIIHADSYVNRHPTMMKSEGWTKIKRIDKGHDAWDVWERPKQRGPSN